MYMALIDPPRAFASLEPPPLLVRALQLEQGASLTLTLTPLADVTPHMLLLGLLAALLKLQAYAPTWNENDPP
jgi:hypothetical protein